MARTPSKKRGPDGKFRVRVGNRNFKSEISWADANRQADVYRQEIKRGLSVDAHSVTVAAYAHKWLPLHKAGVSNKVYNEYARYMNTLIDELGRYAMIDITPDDAMAMFVNHYKPKKTQGGDGYSGSVIRKVKMLYRDFFDSAIENGYAMRNPFRSEKVKAVSGKDGSHRQITEKERQLIHHVQHPFRPAVMTMLYAGLRRGEVLALNADTDISDGAIHVSLAVTHESNLPIIKEPKTEAGKRTVPIFPPLAAELDGLHGLIAPAKHGNEMSGSAFSSAWSSYITTVECHMNGVKQKRWYGLRKEDKIRQPEKYKKVMELKAKGKEKEAEALRLSGWKRFTVRPHDLRHSFCTMLRDAGVDMKQAIEWMGHSDEKMILKIYDHVSERRTAESVKKVEKFAEIEGYSAQNSAFDSEVNSQTIEK